MFNQLLINKHNKMNVEILKDKESNKILIRLARRDQERYRKLIDLSIEKHLTAKDKKQRLYFKSKVKDFRNKLRKATKELNKLQMEAKDQNEIKGIYYNEKSNNVFFVNSVKNGKVIVSTVLTNRLNQMYRVLNDNKIIDLNTFNSFTYSGNYKRSQIND